MRPEAVMRGSTTPTRAAGAERAARGSPAASAERLADGESMCTSSPSISIPAVDMALRRGAPTCSTMFEAWRSS